MKRFGMRKVARYGGVAGVLVAVAVAIAIAAATAAATPNKPYTANVHQTLNTAGSFTFTVTNDPHASQIVGSANFIAPPGVTLTPGTVGTNVSHAGWTAVVNSAGILELRSNSSANGLGPGESVSADVTFATTAQCTATAGSATWRVQAKQSNDFSGAPGNFLQQNLAGSDMTPLGSYVLAPVESVVTAPDGPLHVPQIIVNHAAAISITAKDTCGNVDADYSGGTFGLVSGLALTDFSALSWSNGVGSATVTPVTVEVGDQFSITDVPSGISANSVSTGGNPTFDVVQTICAGGGTSCVWKDPNGKPITASSTVNNDSGGHASLGLGYKGFLSGVSCGVGSPIGDSIEIVPFQYTSNYTVVLTYGKQLVPSGPASGVVICKSTDGGATWDRQAIPPCGNTPVAPCEQAQKVSGGALQVTLYLTPNDPHTGGFTP
ncbi:MAG TPA: hypothetical protein VGK62_04775 [Gaiellaceae bacterium]